MTRIKMHIFNVKLPFYHPCEVKCGLQNRVSTRENDIFGFFGIRHANRWQTKYSINNLTTSEKDALVALPIEFKEVFAWSYEDMLGIDIDIVQYCIPTDPTMKPVKQKLRRMKLEWTLKIKEEVEKQYNAGFLRVVNYLEWLANMVLVPKKDRKVKMCVDFRDLNKACPKDDFSLLHIDILVDNTAGHALLSFMDGFSRYN